MRERIGSKAQAPSSLPMAAPSPPSLPEPEPEPLYQLTCYAKKRRLLRQHREQLRDTDEWISEQGFWDSYQAFLSEVAYDGEYPFGGFFLGRDVAPGGMDEGSDNEDPEAKAMEEARNLRQEAAGSQRLMDAVRGMVDSRTQHQEILLELERARMRAEDRRM